MKEKESLSRQLIQADIERKDAIGSKERGEKKIKEQGKVRDK